MKVGTRQAEAVRPGVGRKMNVMGHAATIRLPSVRSEGDYYVFEVETPPGAGIPPHVHSHEDEIIQVLEGTYAIRLGDEELIAEPGTLLHFTRGVPHGFANVGDAPGRTLWIVVPGGNFEPFFDELGALPEGPPDLARVAEIFGRYGIDLLPPE